MKTKTLLLVTGIFASSLTSALAEGKKKSFGDGTLPDFLAVFDVDESGDLSAEERQAMREARREARRERRDAVLTEFDLDGDGELNEDEREAARAAHRERIETKRSEYFANADADESGGLSMEEFSAIPAVAKLAERRPDAPAKIFDRLDANDDQVVDAEEFAARLRNPRRPRRTQPRR